MEGYFTQEQYLELLAAFREGHMTTASQIVIAQVFKDKGISEYRGENSYELAVRLTDKFWDLFPERNNQGESEEDIKIACDTFYKIMLHLFSD